MHFKAEGEGQLQRFVGDRESALEPTISFLCLFFSMTLSFSLSQQNAGALAQLGRWRRAQRVANDMGHLPT